MNLEGGRYLLHRVGCMSILGQIFFAAGHTLKSEGSFGLRVAQAKTCKGVLLMLQMDDQATKAAG